MASVQGVAAPVIGRVSMDLLAIDVTKAANAEEGDWVSLDFTLPAAAQCSDMSQYELLTSLGSRYSRAWD
jgi:alanine racemase